jgi:hypothetical protein
MTAADWIGVAGLAVAPTLAFMGVVYRAGKLASSVDELAREVARLRTRIDSLEGWARGRNRR